MVYFLFGMTKTSMAAAAALQTAKDDAPNRQGVSAAPNVLSASGTATC
jgi:hypothetical protein